MIRQLYKPRRRGADGTTKIGRLWRGRYKLAGDTRVIDIALRTTDRRVAEKRIAAIISEAEREREGILSPRRLREGAVKPLSEHLRDYVEDLRTKQCNRDYVDRIRQRITRLFNALDWRYLCGAGAEGFVRWRNGQSGLSAKTRNDYLAMLVGLFNWMKRMGRTEANPFEGIGRIDARGKATFSRRSLMADELARLKQVSGKRWVVYLTAVKTGLRRGELQRFE